MHARRHDCLGVKCLQMPSARLTKGWEWSEHTRANKGAIDEEQERRYLGGHPDILTLHLALLEDGCEGLSNLCLVAIHHGKV